MFTRPILIVFLVVFELLVFREIIDVLRFIKKVDALSFLSSDIYFLHGFCVVCQELCLTKEWRA